MEEPMEEVIVDGLAAMRIAGRAAELVAKSMVSHNVQ
jgi:hypothetical protein